MEITTEFIAPNPDVETEFWNFVADRQRIYAKHTSYSHHKHVTPAQLEILKTYRFANVYRMLDRHTQYILHVLENPLYTEYAELLSRIILFRYFNRIEPYQIMVPYLYENHLGSLCISSLVDYRKSGKSLFAPFYHPKQKLGTGIEDTVATQVIELFNILDTVPYLEEILISDDNDNWSAIFYDVLTHAGCTPRQAYQMILDLLLPLSRIAGQTLSRRTELHGISYASKQAIDALELMGIKGPWKAINRAIKALTAKQIGMLESRGFPWCVTSDAHNPHILLTVHDIELCLSQFHKFKHIQAGGRGALYIPHCKENT